MANIFDFRHFLCYHVYKAEIRETIHYFCCHLGFLNSGFTWQCYYDSTIDKFNLENMGVAVEIVFLARLETEIHLGGYFYPSSST